MKTVIEDWDESLLDTEDYQVERALTNAALDAIRRVHQYGSKYIIYEDGQVKAIPAEETAPYEAKLRENLDRLNKKITQMEAQDTLILNDKPKP